MISFWVLVRAGLLAAISGLVLIIAPALAQSPQMPHPLKLNMLVRTTVIALNQANQTGNYTVLRDLSAPAFQQTNTAARLGEIFAKLRRRKLNLSPILFFQPKLTRQAAITKTGLLRVTGFFSTRPEQINFDMLFQFVGGEWRLFGLAVDVGLPKTANKQVPAKSASVAKPAPSLKQKARQNTHSRIEPRGRTKLMRAQLPAPKPVPLPERRPSPAPSAQWATSTSDAATGGGAAKQAGQNKSSQTSFWPF